MVHTYMQEQILEKLNALVVVLDQSGHAEYVSNSAANLLGYDTGQLIGKKWWENTRFSLPEGEQTRLKLLDVMNKSNGCTQVVEHQLRTSKGMRKWIRWNVSLLEDGQIIGIGYDITDQKRQEDQLREQHVQLIQQHKQITDSIVYARRIQQHSLQSESYIKQIFREHFVLYKPKDLVSDDHYFFHQDEEFKYVIALDCTGHGVPGAMMSMVANSIVKEVLLNKKVKSPSGILYEMDRELYKAINSYSHELSRDGMDVCVISISKKSGRMHFAGAFRPLIVVRDGQVIEMKGSKFPLGSYVDVEKVFEEQVLVLNKGDMLYLFSDGYTDQFGGEHGKKLKRTNFKELLKLAAEMAPDEQLSFLEYSLNNWKQDEEQTDDVLVLGIRI